MNRLKRNLGFTILELLIAVGLLGAIGIGTGAYISNSFKESNQIADKVDIQTSVTALMNKLETTIKTADIPVIKDSTEGVAIKNTSFEINKLQGGVVTPIKFEYTDKKVVSEGIAYEHIEEIEIVPYNNGAEIKIVGLENKYSLTSSFYSRNTISFDEVVNQSGVNVVLAEGDTWYDASKVSKQDIKKITLKNKYTPTGDERADWNADEDGSGDIICYVTADYELIISGQSDARILANKNSEDAFSGFSSVISIEGLHLLNTSNVEDMNNMFYNTSVSKLNLSSFDTNKVTNMNSIFEGTELDEITLGTKFKFVGSDNGLDTSTWYLKNGQEVTIESYQETVTEATTYYATNIGATYIVKHYFENIDNSGYTLHLTETKTASGSTVTFSHEALTNAGMTYKEGKVGSIAATTSSVLNARNFGINLYYTRNIYTLTLQNRGLSYSEVDYKYGKNVEINAGESNKYKFTGWYYADDSLYSKEANTSIVMTEDTILCSKWEQYTLTYDANGGSGAPASEKGINFTISSTVPTRTGYTFKGWALTNTATSTNYQAGASITLERDTTLYAVWTANAYTVILDGQGATSTDHKTSVEATYDSAMPTVTVPSRVYTVTYNYNGNGTSNTTATSTYIFGGYYDGTNGSGTQYYKADGTSARTWNKTAATTLYAKWTEKSVTLPTPTRTGYTFNGWYVGDTTSKAGNGGASYTPTGNVILKASWTANKNTITLDGQGATSTNHTTSIEATYDSSMPTPITKPSRVYTVTYNANGGSISSTTSTSTYTFGGYFDGTNGNGTQYYKADGTSARTWNKTSATTLYASWTSVNVTLLTPIRTNYKFLGWSTDSSATSVTYTDKQSITPTSNITLYAVWEKEIKVLADVATVGAYVTYVPSSTSYTVPTTVSGCTNDQTFTPSNTTSWRVFSVDGENIEIISTDSVGNLSLEGRSGYANPSEGSVAYTNAVQTLNDMSVAYVNPSVATSGRSLGYSEDGLTEEEIKNYRVIDTLIYPLEHGISDALPYNDSQFTTDKTVLINNKSMNHSSGFVWLASRAIGDYNGDTRFYMNIMDVNPVALDEGYTSNYLYYVTSDGTAGAYSNSYGVRPIVSLKPELAILRGEGTVDSPYVITEETTSQCTITYSANGGYGEMIPQSVAQGSNITLNENAYEHHGDYIFKGWSTSATSTTATYIDGQNITPTADMTLYAVWKEVPTLATDWKNITQYGGWEPDILTIKQLNIFDTYTPSNSTTFQMAIDVNRTGSIMMYIEGEKLTIAGNGSGKIYANPYSGYAFSGFHSLISTSGFDLLDTSKVVNMVAMFYKNTQMTKLDVSKFNTSKVTNMERMFQECDSLTELDVSGFDTSNVTDMSDMFGNCFAVLELDVSKWDTSNVTDMSYMFGCTSVERLDVSKFDTSNVVNMESMFYGGGSLRELDVSGFDTSNVTNMSRMFPSSSYLKELDVSGFDTSNVTNMAAMFGGCGVIELDLSNFDTSNVTDMSTMFNGCGALKKLNLSSFDTSSVTNMENMFGDDYIYGNNLWNLEEVVLGPYFSFDGGGSTYCELPAPSSSYIIGADNQYWYTAEGNYYSPRYLAAIKRDVITTYYAVNPQLGIIATKVTIKNPDGTSRGMLETTDSTPILSWDYSDSGYIYLTGAEDYDINGYEGRLNVSVNSYYPAGLSILNDYHLDGEDLIWGSEDITLVAGREYTYYVYGSYEVHTDSNYSTCVYCNKTFCNRCNDVWVPCCSYECYIEGGYGPCTHSWDSNGSYSFCVLCGETCYHERGSVYVVIDYRYHEVMCNCGKINFNESHYDINNDYYCDGCGAAFYRKLDYTK